jgi:hypothetical protein
MEMIVSTDIDALVARRNAIINELEGAKDAFDRAKKLYQDGPVGHREYGQSNFENLAKQFHFDHTKSMDAMMTGFDAEAWRYLMDASGLESSMSTSASEKWYEQINKRETPPLTKENIVATFKDLFVRKDEIFEQGVIEAFRSCSWDHKTNQPVKFGKKVIFAHCYGDTHCQKVDDLRRVLHVSDGKPQPDHRHGVWAKFIHQNSRWIAEDDSGAKQESDPLTRRQREVLRQKSLNIFEDEYVQVEKFKNGNLHCKFKRPDLTQKLNAILAKHHPNALPAPR